jgi:hypothetical protein
MRVQLRPCWHRLDRTISSMFSDWPTFQLITFLPRRNGQAFGRLVDECIPLFSYLVHCPLSMFLHFIVCCRQTRLVFHNFRTGSKRNKSAVHILFRKPPSWDAFRSSARITFPILVVVTNIDDGEQFSCALSFVRDKHSLWSVNLTGRLEWGIGTICG